MPRPVRLALSCLAVMTAATAAVPAAAITAIVLQPQPGDEPYPLALPGAVIPSVGPDTVIYAFRNTDPQHRHMKDMTIYTRRAEDITILGEGYFGSRMCGVQTACNVYQTAGKTGVGWQQSFRLHLSGALENQQLTIVPSFVPEPAAWGLLVAGFALTGAMLRRRPVPACGPAGAGV